MNSLDTEVPAHAVIVLQHLLVSAQVYRPSTNRLTELVVVLSVLSIADCAVLIDDPADLHDPIHPRRVPSELDDLDLPL